MSGLRECVAGKAVKVLAAPFGAGQAGGRTRGRLGVVLTGGGEKPEDLASRRPPSPPGGRSFPVKGGCRALLSVQRKLQT